MVCRPLSQPQEHLPVTPPGGGLQDPERREKELPLAAAAATPGLWRPSAVGTWILRPVFGWLGRAAVDDAVSVLGLYSGASRATRHALARVLGATSTDPDLFGKKAEEGPVAEAAEPATPAVLVAWVAPATVA